MFRLQENVPEVYVKHSRDFQTFCRIYDVINNSLRFNALSAENLLNPLKVNDKMLPLLATRVGFFPKHEYNTQALRQVISAFPYIIKYKGSKQGIEMALNVILKIENNYKDNLVYIDKDTSTVRILTETRIRGEDLLRDVLSYILPIGYEIIVSTFVRTEVDDKDNQLDINVSANQESLNPTDISIVISSESIDPDKSLVENRAIGSYTTAKTIQASDLINSEETDNNG